MRTFIAVELTDAARRYLAGEVRRLRSLLAEQRIAHDFIRWTAPANIHVTLRFLGETSATQGGELAAALAAVAQCSAPFVLSIEGVGCFPNFRRPSVIWLGVGGELGALGRLQGDVEAAARMAGFAPEERAFSPHLTVARLGREVSPAALAAVGEAVQQHAQTPRPPPQDLPGARFGVDQVVHMRSDLKPSGAVYTPIAHFSLM